MRLLIEIKLIAIMCILNSEQITLAQQVTKDSISLLSVSSDLYAGNELLLEARVYDTNGLIPGTFCTNVVYQDTLGAAVGQVKPIVKSSAGSIELNQRPDTTNKVYQCFSNGIDTLRIVLYNAPVATNLHQIWMKIGKAENSTVPFRLQPGATAILRIWNSLTNSDTNMLTLYYPNSSVLLTAKVYDKWNNEESGSGLNCSWGQTGTLDPIGFPYGLQIFYGTSAITQEELGYIIVATNRNPILKDSIYISIQAPASVKNISARSMTAQNQIGNKTMINLTGRIMNKSGENGLRNFANGVYLLRKDGDENQQSKNIIVKK